MYTHLLSYTFHVEPFLMHMRPVWIIHSCAAMIACGWPSLSRFILRPDVARWRSLHWPDNDSPVDVYRFVPLMALSTALFLTAQMVLQSDPGQRSSVAGNRGGRTLNQDVQAVLDGVRHDIVPVLEQVCVAVRHCLHPLRTVHIPATPFLSSLTEASV